MGLSFLGPLFLAGLAALSVPLLVHLVRRSDAPARRFPSLMFISRIDHPVRQRRHVEHWGLLILRCIALAMIVLAFAQPTFEGQTLDRLVGDRPRDVVLLVDQSYSMGYAEHWPRARVAAHQAVESLSPQDRVALVFFDERAHVATELTADRERLRRAIDARAPSAYATDFAAALAQAAHLLAAGSSDAEREIRVISDFQRSALDPADAIALPDDTGIAAIDITSPDTENTAVTVAGPLLASGKQANRVSVAANILNLAAESGADRRIVLEVDGREIESRAVTVPGGAIRTEHFEVARPAQGQARATLQIDADALTADDRFRFALGSHNRHAVLVLDDGDATNRANVYLASALRVSDAPAFDVVVKPASRFETSDLDRVSAVVVNDARMPEGEPADALRRFLARGGGLLVVAGDLVRDQWPEALNGHLPGRLGRVTTPPGPGGIALDAPQTGHAALAAFGAPRSGDFSSVRIQRYRRLRTGPDDTVLVRYADGEVALAERAVGRGRALVVTTTLDGAWNDLPLQPLFVPLLNEIVKYLVAFEPRPAWYTVGEVIDAATVLGVRAQSIAVETPSGAKRQLDRTRPVLRLDEPGWYELHTMGQPARSGVVAVNVDPAESDLTPLDVPAFAARLRERRSPLAAGERRTSVDKRADQRDEQRVWWYLLLVGAALLLAETVWSNRITAAPARSKGVGGARQLEVPT